MRKYTLQEIQNIEKILSRISIREISFGNVLRSQIFPILAFGIVSDRNFFRQLLASIKNTLFPWRLRSFVPLPYDRPIFMTCLAMTTHNRELIMPVLSNLNPCICAVLGKKKTMKQMFDSELAFFTWNDLPMPGPWQWFHTFFGNLFGFLKAIYEIKLHYQVSLKFLFHLFSLYVSQTFLIIRSDLYFSNAKHQLLLTEFDRYVSVAPLVLAAKKYDIVTATMVHSLFNGGFGFVPPLADQVLCWGELHIKDFTELGIDSSRLRVVGCQRLRKESNVEQSEVLAKLQLSLDTGEQVAVLATNPINIEKRLHFVTEFCETLSQVPNWHGVIRLHQSESLTVYNSIIKKYPHIMVLENNVLGLEESIALADVVIVHNSGYAFDAINYGTPVGIFNILPIPLLSIQNLIDHDVAVLLNSNEQLKDFLKMLNYDTSYIQKLESKIANYRKQFCAAYGLDAAENIINVIQEVVDVGVHINKMS